MTGVEDSITPQATRRLTALGRRLAALPLHPRIGRLLLAGAEAGLLREAATLAALLSEKDIIAGGHPSRRRQAAWEGASDLIDRLDLIEHDRHSPDVDPQALRAVERVRDELIATARHFATAPVRHHSPEDHERALLRVILHAYPDRVTLRRTGDPSRGVMVGGRGIVLEPACVVRQTPLFLSIDPRDASGGFGTGAMPGGASESRVSLASAIEEAWLGEIFPHLLQLRTAHRFDPERGRVIGLRQIVFAGLVVREEAVGARASAHGVEEALFDYLRRDTGALFAADEAAERWLARARFLRNAMPELELPQGDPVGLESALREACAGCTGLDQVRRRLRLALESQLSWRQRAALDEHAPETLAVPSGSRIRLDYTPDAPPALAVRLQELFGLAETPRIAAGRVPVVLHLLSPNHRPVQVTSDLKSFWNGAYAEVRRDLRARYPKHPWPEDPWNAPPVSVGRRHPR